MTVAGIDPGQTGGLGIIYADGSTMCLDVPFAGKAPDWQKWARSWWFALSEAQPEDIAIESVSAMPKQGVSSTFKFGETLGFVHGICLLACPNAVIHWPSPALWKRKMGVSSDKKETSAEARRLFPKMTSDLARVKDNGKAEALLIALYLKKFG